MRKKCIWNWNWHARKEIEYWDEWGKWHGFFTALSFIGSIIFIRNDGDDQFFIE